MMSHQVIIIAFLAYTTVVHAQAQNLIPGALGGVLGNITTAPVPKPSCNDIVCQTAQLAAAGIRVQIVNETLTVGAITLPIDLLCRNNDSYVYAVVCHICNLDCIYIHNRYGGICNKDSGKGNKGTVCNCFDAPQTQAVNGIFTSSQEICPPLTTEAFDALVLDPVLAVELQVRYAGAQCFANGTGCSVDVYDNHQYDFGLCVNDTSRTNATDKLIHGYCEGLYETSSGGSTTLQPFTSPNPANPAPQYTTVPPTTTTKKSIIGTIIGGLIGAITG